MKLAEALIIRAANNRRLDELTRRIQGNLWIQEGDKPAEDVSALLTELEKLIVVQTGLIRRINYTNSLTIVDTSSKASMSDLIAERDDRRTRQRIWMVFANGLRAHPGRQAKSEIKFIPTASTKDMSEIADTAAKSLRNLDTQIQAANWTTELL